MESRSQVSKDFGLEGLRSRLGLGLEGFRSRSRAPSLETLRRLLLKHAGEVFFVLRNANFFKFKNASELLLRKGFVHKSFIHRANNASCLISYFDVLL